MPIAKPITRRLETGQAPRSLRGLIAVVALYALVLQALLGGIVALPVAGSPGFLCAPVLDASTVGQRDAAPDKHQAPAVPHAGCCTAVSHAPLAALPAPPASGPAWHDPPAARAAWPGSEGRTATPPPFTLAHARAPPAA